jgi:hypothetical protein
LEGYNYFRGINNLVDATLVTHIRNKPALEKHPKYEKSFYFEEKNLANNIIKWSKNSCVSGDRGIEGTLYPTLGCTGCLTIAGDLSLQELMNLLLGCSVTCTPKWYSGVLSGCW